MRNKWQLNWTRTGSNDGIVEVHGGHAIGAFHGNAVWTGKFTQTIHHLHFTHLRHTGQTASQLADNFFFPQTDLVDVGAWLTKHDPVLGQ